MTNIYPVTVVIPAHNARLTLARAIMSALDCGANEVVVVDDASTDYTEIILREFRHADSRVHSVRNAFRAGVIYSRNRAVDYATNELIFPLDADDKLLNLGAAVEAYEPGRWVYGGWREWENTPPSTSMGVWHDFEPPPPGMLARKELGWVSMLFSKADWRAVGGYDPDFNLGNEIWAFQCALTMRGVLPKRIPDTLFERSTDAPRTQRARAWAHVIKALIHDKYPTLPNLREAAPDTV